MRTLASVLGAFLMVLPSSATAQSPSQPASDQSGEEIVVRGSKPQKRVQTFVKTLVPVHMDGQVGRFVDPVCPAAIGLTPRENSLIVDRFRQVSKASGAAVAELPCAANVLLIAARNKRAFIESIPRFAPSLVKGLKRERIDALARSASPVSAWQVTTTLDQNGLLPGLAALDPDIPTGRAEMLVTNDSSRLNKPSQVGVAVAVLVVEKDALAKISTRQFADYAAMRTLAPVDPLSARHKLSGNPHSDLPAPSILTLFDRGLTPEAAPPSVTWWDFAFLQALYDMGMTKSAIAQRSEIQAKMQQILAKVPADDM